MNEYLLIRLLKLLAVSLLASGLIGASISAIRRNRILGLQWSSIGFAVAWIAGYAMLANPREDLKQDWILWSIVWSLVAMLLQALYVHGQIDRFWLGGLATGAIGGAFISMILRDAAMSSWLMLQGILTILVLVLFYLTFRFRHRALSTTGQGYVEPGNAGKLQTDTSLDAIQSWSWFKWIARFEGLSIILLMLIYMPLKYAADIVLDEGSGLVGWIHGVMFVLYTGALVITGPFLGWSWKRIAMGFLAAQIPLGSFLFEWNCYKNANIDSTRR